MIIPAAAYSRFGAISFHAVDSNIRRIIPNIAAAIFNAFLFCFPSTISFLATK